MARVQRPSTSRSLAIYRWLLQLYPAEYLRRHRAEMLQNFEDLQHASPSLAALWLLIGRDLMVSLKSHYMPRSFWGQTTLMLVILAMVLAVLRLSASYHYFMGAATVCYGFVIGWFAGWLGKQRQIRA